MSTTPKRSKMAPSQAAAERGSPHIVRERFLRRAASRIHKSRKRTTGGRTLDSARQVFSDDAPLQRNARDTLEQVAKAAASVRVLTDYLDRHPEALIRGKAKDAQ